MARLQRAEMGSFQRRQEQPWKQGNESRENGKARENVILKTQKGLRGKEHTDWSLRREGGILCSLRQCGLHLLRPGETEESRVLKPRSKFILKD